MSSTERRRFCCDADLALIGYDGRDAAKDLATLRSQGPAPRLRRLMTSSSLRASTG
jgi:hypothetical protein